MNTPIIAALLVVVALSLSACEKSKTDITAAQPQITAPTRAQPAPEKDLPTEQFPHNPLVTHIYTADPSAHVFNNRLYIYPSHDIDSKSTATGSGARFDMVDYHVLSMAEAGGQVTDHGPALHIGKYPGQQNNYGPPTRQKKTVLITFIFRRKTTKIFFASVSLNPKSRKALLFLNKALFRVPSVSTPQYSKTTTAVTTYTLVVFAVANCSAGNTANTPV